MFTIGAKSCLHHSLISSSSVVIYNVKYLLETWLWFTNTTTSFSLIGNSNARVSSNLTGVPRLRLEYSIGR